MNRSATVLAIAQLIMATAKAVALLFNLNHSVIHPILTYLSKNIYLVYHHNYFLHLIKSTYNQINFKWDMVATYTKILS
jgi:hypothetical protein